MRGRDQRTGQIAGVTAAVFGLAVVGVRSGAQVASLGTSCILPTLVGAAALLWFGWRLGGLNTGFVAGRRPLALMATGAVGALEVLLIASLVLFCALLTLLALGAGGDWISFAGLTQLLGESTPGAAGIAALIGIGWGVTVALSRRR